VPYRSRSQLARDSLDFMAQQVPRRPIWSLADGGYATKDYVRRTSVAAPRAKKGDLSGSPKILAQTANGG